jgi:hypothetical protein
MGYAEELRIWANKRVAEYKRQQLSTAQAQRQWVHDQQNLAPKKLGEFKSKTSKSVYKVYDYGGRITCNCPGFVFRHNCRHITEVV